MGFVQYIYAPLAVKCCVAIKMFIGGRKIMSIPYINLSLWCNKVKKDGKILCAYLDPFRWPGHILFLVFLATLSIDFMIWNTLLFNPSSLLVDYSVPSVTK